MQNFGGTNKEYYGIFESDLCKPVRDRLKADRPFPSSPKSLLQSESKCEIFVMVIRSNFNMNEN